MITLPVRLPESSMQAPLAEDDSLRE